jgi:hypothetical protein
VFRIALPPLRLALRERYLKVRRVDPIALRVAVEELATVERIPRAFGAARLVELKLTYALFLVGSK